MMNIDENVWTGPDVLRLMNRPDVWGFSEDETLVTPYVTKFVLAFWSHLFPALFTFTSCLCYCSGK